VKTILVTGGLGFIGAHLTRKLASLGFDVATVDLKPNSASYCADITSLASLNMVFKKVLPQIVFHLAVYGFEESEQNPEKSMLTNAIGTLNVLKLAKKHDVQKVVFSSSGTVYGKPETLPLNESHPTNPRSVYGVTKLAGEFFCRMMMTRGLNITILRYSNVLGPNRNFGVIHIFKERTLKGLPLPVFGGRQSNDYIYVGDVVDANVKCILKGDGETFNIGSGKEVSIMELACALRKKYGGTNEIQVQPSRPHDPTWRFCYDASKAEKVLGWKPTLNFTQILDKMYPTAIEG